MPFWPTSRRIEGTDITFTAFSRLSPSARQRLASHPGQESWSNPKVLTVFFLLFLCGVTFGSLLTSTILHRHIRSASTSQMSLSQLKERLQLTSEQEQVVTKELDDYVKYYQNIEEEREDVAEHGKRRILSVLTPDQKKTFLAMFKASSLPTRADSDQ